MSEISESNANNLLEGIRRNSGMVVFMGILIMTVGMMAILSPLVAGTYLMMAVGVLLVFGGIGQCVVAFSSGAFGSGIFIFMVGAFTVVAGAIMIEQPMAALVTVTLFIAGYLFFSGIIEVVAAMRVRPMQGWGWMLAGGVVSLSLGMLLWRQFPFSGAWAIGTLVGLKLVMSGMTLLVLGVTARQLAKQATTE